MQNCTKRHTAISLSASLNIPPIREFVYQLTVKFFSRCPNNPNPLINTIGNYSLTDLQSQYPKYTHKRPKHILLWKPPQLLQCFFPLLMFFHCLTENILTADLSLPLLPSRDNIREIGIRNSFPILSDQTYVRTLWAIKLKKKFSQLLVSVRKDQNIFVHYFRSFS